MAAVAPVLFPEMRSAWCGRGRDGVPPLSLRGYERDHPAVDRAHRHRVGDRRVHRRTVHRRHDFLPWYSRWPWASSPGGVHEARTWKGSPRAPARVVGRAFIVAIPALVLPFLIRAAVVEGVATATEGLNDRHRLYGVVAGLLIYRPIRWRRLYRNARRNGGAVRRHPVHHRHGQLAMAWALT